MKTPPENDSFLLDSSGHSQPFSKRLTEIAGIDPDWVDPVQQRCERFAECGEAVLDLINTNPTEVHLDYSCYSQVWQASSVDAALLRYQPDPAGSMHTRQALAEYYSCSYGCGLDPQQIFLTASTSEAYAVLFELLTDPGDHILISRPGYPLIDVIANLAGLQLDSFDLHQQGNGHWVPDMENLTSCLHPRTRAVVCVSPHNPTGSGFQADQWRQMDEFCLRHNLSLIVDEVFRDYSTLPTSSHNLPFAQKCRTFILNGMSKLSALPQLKLAWIFLAGSGSDHPNTRGCLEYLLDSRLSVSSFAQVCVPGILNQSHHLQEQLRFRIALNHKELAAFAQINGIYCHPYLGGWYGLLGVAEQWRHADASLLLARHCGVKIHPGFFYGLPDSIAVSLSLIVPEADLRLGLKRIAQFIS